jgi:hypothetical protein
MAMLSLSIPDELHQVYIKYFPQNPQKGMAKQLERFKDVDPAARAIVFAGEDLKNLQILTGGTVETPNQVIECLRKAISLDIAGVSVALNEGQAKRAASLANFFNKTMKQFLTDTVKDALVFKLGA